MLTMEKETQPDDTVLSLDGVNFLMDSTAHRSLKKQPSTSSKTSAAESALSSTTPCSLGRWLGRADAVAAAAVVAVEAAAAVAAALIHPF